MFPQAILSAFEYAEHNGYCCDKFWCAPWLGILSTLFPVEEGYTITSSSKMDRSGKELFTVIEVNQFYKLPAHFETLLILQVRNQPFNDLEKLKVELDLENLVSDSFRRWAGPKVFWITVMGGYWQYRCVTDHDKVILEPLTDWHCQIKDEESFDSIQELSKLVHEYCKTETD